MAEGYLKRETGFLTKAAHGGFDPKQEFSWPLVPSLTLSSCFEQESPEWYREFRYGRINNPIRQVLEKALAQIESAQYALCFSSGMATVTNISFLLNSGDHVVAAKELFGGTNYFFSEILPRMNIQTTFVDARDSESIREALKENTKLLWLETPSNPLLKITDIAKASEVAHAHKDVLVVVDNTFASPYFQKPLTMGADISMNSITKYINGHHDVVMGCIATNRKDVYDRLYIIQTAIGAIPSPFDCYQVHRSLKTLPLRMEQHMRNAMQIATFLETSPYVERVVYPEIMQIFHIMSKGLPSHPQHELVKKQCYGSSGMLSFYLKGGIDHVKALIKSLKIIKYAGSLGGCTTTVTVPFLMSHASMSVKDKTELGVTENLIRMTVGLESAEDLIQDLEQAFKTR